jgi:PAS domain-containing protein
MSTAQRPLELILARNLMTSLSTPAFLTDESGEVIFYNDAAGRLLGRRFEEVRGGDASIWEHVGPFDRDGHPVPIEDLPLTIALRNGSPAHASLCIHAFDGVPHDIEVSALPIVSAEGSRGAMAFFWPDGEAPA